MKKDDRQKNHFIDTVKVKGFQQRCIFVILNY
jgi:hypothetical protein